MPQAVKGVLDLKGWDVKTQGPVQLSGEWEFYRGKMLWPEDFLLEKDIPPHEYVKVPGDWITDPKRHTGQGYGTYRLKVLHEPILEEDFGLWIKEIGASYRIFVNGSLLAQAGFPGTTKVTTRPEHRPQVIDFTTEGRTQEIIIQFANYYNRSGGIRENILLGTDTQVEELKDRSVYYSLFFLGAILIIGIYHLILYCFRSRDASTLIFGMLCFIVGIRTLTTGNYFIVKIFPGIWWELVNKIEYITFFLGVPLFCYFIYKLFPREFLKAILLGIMGIGAAFSVLTVVTPITVYVWVAEVFDLLTVLIGLYVLFVISNASMKKRFGAVILLLGAVILFVTVLNDVLYSNLMINTTVLAPLGLFLFVVLQSIVMSMRYAKSFNEVELLSSELEMKSQDLELKNIKLTELDRIKDEFLANTSHEIRSPIDSISGLAESMLDEAGDKLSSSQMEHLRMILGSAKRLSRLVNDIMDLTRMRRGDIHLDIKPVDIHSAVDMVLNLYRPLILAKGLRLIDNIERLPKIMADEDRLQQIIHNIISNAVKYTQEGEIEISAHRVDEMVVMSVRDTGSGIPNDMKESILYWGEEDAFGNNKGLGLAITRKLIEIQQGSISIESTLGKGSLVAFSLPVAAEVEQRNEADEKPVEFSRTEMPLADSGATGIRVLAVDDDEISLRLMSDMLAREGFSVIALTSGEEALERLKDQVNVDVILLDVMMPEMSGFEVCREIRKEFKVSELPVLFLMSKNQAVDIRDAFETGVNDYIVKPFSKYELTSRLRFHVNLCRSSNELRQLKDNLALMVRDRTKELEAALEELARANEALKELSLKDGLTGVRNRRYFDERYQIEWERALREQYPISVLMIDIDHFKDINDRYGHLIGDECLKGVASVIKRCIERSTDEVARYGGEEFIVTLFNTPYEGAYYLAEKIRRHVQETSITDNGHNIKMTVSIGIATMIPPGKDCLDQLVALADAAMYDAKNQGRNRVCFAHAA